VLAFDRDELTCVVNVSGPDVRVEGVLLASEDVGGRPPARRRGLAQSGSTSGDLRPA
jgi:hypothetical protein